MFRARFKKRQGADCVERLVLDCDKPALVRAVVL
jgi:hypothetical protein